MKQTIISFIRKIGLIKGIDYMRYIYIISRKRQTLKKYKTSNIPLPPPYFIYETYRLNYDKYISDGKETAQWLLSYIERYKELKDINILDWGCGPARVVRNLPDLLDCSCKCYASDYNKKYIVWCQKNIKNVEFKENNLNPPLNYKNNSFDVVYAISIFTHLSSQVQKEWFDELIRVLKPNGIMFLTLQGDAFKTKLTNKEKQLYDEGLLVERGNTKEGHRTFAAFQPDSFVENLVKENKILLHQKGKEVNNKPQQDVWLIQKQII